MIIAFSGDDCCGKSTQIAALRLNLERQGWAVTTYWHRPGYSTELNKVKRILRRVLARSTPVVSASAQGQRAFGSPLVRRLWIWVACVDLIYQYGLKLRWISRGNRVLILDRYWLDAALDLRMRFAGFDPSRSWLFRICRAVAPRPTHWFVLWASWDVIMKRVEEKQEPFPDPVETRRARHQQYCLHHGQGPWTVVDANGRKADVAATIFGHVRDRYARGMEGRAKLTASVKSGRQSTDESPNTNHILWSSRTGHASTAILAIGAHPPPVTGQSVAFRTVVDGLGLDYLDIGDLRVRSGSTFSVHRALQVLLCVPKAIWRARGKRVVYLTTACSLTGFARDLALVAPLWLLRKRLVAHVHQGCFLDFMGSLPRFVRWLLRWTYRRFDRVIVLSELFVDDFAFLRASRVVVVPNAAGDRDGPVAVPPSSERRVLFLSNLIESKGVLTLMDAMRLLPDYYVLDLAGAFMSVRGDSDAESLKGAVLERAARLGQGRVRLHGVVEGSEKENLLRAAHVLVLPTWYRNEAQPICVAEALLAGVPVVSSRFRDLAVMIDESRGRFVDPRNPESVATAIIEVCESAESWLELSRAAHNFASARHSTSRHLERMAQHLTVKETTA